MRRILLLAFALLCLTFPALAEDVYTIDDATQTAACTTDRSYLRVKCPLAGEQYVTLRVCDAWGGVVYQRDHGFCRGTFRSEDIYLRLAGASTRYTVTLQIGSEVHQIRVTREQARLTDSGVYAWGLPVSELNGRASNKYALILDVDALADDTLTAPLVSGDLRVGEVYCTFRDRELTVTAELNVAGEIVKGNVYVARDAVTAQTLGTNHFSGKKIKLGRSIDLSGTPYAAVMVQLTVSYDAGDAQTLWPDEWFQEEQRTLWWMMQMMTANEAVG